MVVDCRVYRMEGIVLIWCRISRRTAMTLTEMNSREGSIAGAAAIHIWLAPPKCSPVATVDIAFNETSPMRLTNPQSH